MVGKSNYAAIVIPMFCVALAVFTASCSEDNPVEGTPTDAFMMSEENAVYKSVLNSIGPRAVWTNNGALVVWSEIPPGKTYTDIILARIDSTGKLIGDIRQVAREFTQDARPSIVWTGVSAVIVWHGGSMKLKARSFSAEGDPLADEDVLGNVPPYDSGEALSWTGTNVVYLWSSDKLDENRNKIYLARTDAQGMFIGDFKSITNGEDAMVISARWANSKLYVVWKGTDPSSSMEGTAYFCTPFLSDGKIAGPTSALFPGLSTRFASLACDGGSRFLICRDESDELTSPHLRCTVYDNAFNIQHETAITTPQQGRTDDISNLACSGGNFMITWTDTQVKAVVIGTDGYRESRSFVVSEGSAYAMESHVASTPFGYIIVWRDWRDGNGGNIYARSVLVR